MKRLLFLTSLVVWSGVAQAQEIGLDFLGIKSRAWNCDAMMAAVNTLPKPIPCGAFIDDTFGKSDDCILRLLASGKVSIFRGHFKWTDNHQLASLPSLIPTAIKFNSWAQRFPNVQFRPSAHCEHWGSEQQIAAVHNGLVPYLPNAPRFVDSGQRAFDRRYTREEHGNDKPRPGTAFISQDGGDNDGNGMLDVFARKLTRKAREVYYLWDKMFNCRRKDDKRRPADRTDCPTPSQFMHAVRLTYPAPPPPPGVMLPAPNIYKPSSDNHGGTPRDPRGCQGKDCKPVYISARTNKPSISIKTLQGRVVTQFPRFGPFNCDKRNPRKVCGYRYYAPMSAFDLNQLVERMSGSEYAYIEDGSNLFLFNPLERGGASR